MSPVVLLPPEVQTGRIPSPDVLVCPGTPSRTPARAPLDCDSFSDLLGFDEPWFSVKGDVLESGSGRWDWLCFYAPSVDSTGTLHTWKRTCTYVRTCWDTCAHILTHTRTHGHTSGPRARLGNRVVAEPHPPGRAPWVSPPRPHLSFHGEPWLPAPSAQPLGCPVLGHIYSNVRLASSVPL